MKNILILLIIVYIILFVPIKIIIKNISPTEVIINIRLFLFIDIPLKYYLKDDLNTIIIRKFLLNINNEVSNKKILFNDLLKIITLKKLNLTLFTNNSYLVSSYYILFKLLDVYLENNLYLVENKNYTIRYSDENSIYYFADINLKLNKLIYILIKNFKIIKKAYLRRKQIG